MKAKCPECCGESQECHKCDGTGYVTARFAKGDVYTRHCTSPECGFDNGGRIVPDGAEVGEPPDPCVMCGSFAKWLLVGRSG